MTIHLRFYWRGEAPFKTIVVKGELYCISVELPFLLRVTIGVTEKNLLCTVIIWGGHLYFEVKSVDSSIQIPYIYYLSMERKLIRLGSLFCLSRTVRCGVISCQISFQIYRSSSEVSDSRSF